MRVSSCDVCCASPENDEQQPVRVREQTNNNQIMAVALPTVASRGAVRGACRRGPAAAACVPRLLRPSVMPATPPPSSRGVVARATEQEDFDAVLMKYAEKWEKTDNKPVVVAWIAGAFALLFTAEWLIHLPVLNFLLGFPVQLVGLFTIPWLGVRWFVDGVKPGDDIDKATASIVGKLPGLEKK